MGFKMAPTKVKCIHFCKHQRCPDPELYIGNTPIEVVPKYKFLGVIFDKKHTYKYHISDLKVSCMKANNILKVVSHQSWGADRTTKLRLYRILIRQKLDYGSIIYGNTKESLLKPLRVVQNSALRISLGAFCTSPIISLEVEANEPPMVLRREQLAMMYMMKIKAVPNNPAHE